jgi:hypothetical protein
MCVFTIKPMLDPNHRTIPTHRFVTDRTTPTPSQISADQVTPVFAAVTPEPYPHPCHSGFRRHPLPTQFSTPTHDPPHPVLRRCGVLRRCTWRVVSDDIKVLCRMRWRRHGVRIHTATPQANRCRGTCRNDPSAPSTTDMPPLMPST